MYSVKVKYYSAFYLHLLNGLIVILQVIKKRVMVDKKKPDQTKIEPSRHYTNELCSLSTEKADEVVGRSLKLYVSRSEYYSTINAVTGSNR